MKVFGVFKSNFIFFAVISIIYLLYITLFIKPWEFSNFSLVDDGQVLLQSSAYFKNCLSSGDCSKFVDQTFELGTSRFRPTYWIINNINYEIFGLNATMHHVYRAYVVGYIAIICLAIILIGLKIQKLLALIFVSLFFTTFSFSENIIRLGTNEPYQIVFLAIFSIIYLSKKSIKEFTNSKRIFLILLLIWTLLIKENNVAILPAIFLTEILASRKNILDKTLIIFLCIPFVLFIVPMYLTKISPSTISGELPIYASNYSKDPLVILNNIVALSNLIFVTMSPFLKLGLLLVPIVYATRKYRVNFANRNFYYWLLMSVFFVTILLPWRYVIDRYQLVGIFGLTIVVAFIFNQGLLLLQNEIITKLFKFSYTSYIFSPLFLVFLSNLFFRGFPINFAKTLNYQTWFANFTQFEADQVFAISKYNSSDGVYLNAVDNINDWEFLYEIPIHLKYVYGQNPNVHILNKDKINKGYLFSRSSLDTYLPHENLGNLNYQLLEGKKYNITQIDTLKFKQEFINRPLHTLVKPPLQSVGFDYEWGVYTHLND